MSAWHTTMGALDQQWTRLLGPTSPEGGKAGARVVAWHVPASASERVGQVWTGVQPGLPAPAIAVDGESGWLLCFALPAAQPCDEACRALAALIERVLTAAAGGVPPDDVATWRWSCWPFESAEPGAWPVPRQTGADRWSAFVAPDLVPVFADTPWLDCAPGDEGQAVLLARLQPIGSADWQRLLADAQPVVSRVVDANPGLGRQAPPRLADDPRDFLRAVMNDTTVEMALRIEAARVLLAHG